MTRSVVATSRIRRAASLAAAGLQTHRLRNASVDKVRETARHHLAQRLGRLRGLPQKLGQLLSMNETDDTTSAFVALTESADPVPLEDLMPVLHEQWSCNPDDIIGEIDPRGLAASLGQVHRAVLHDGRTVAIKIQYPGIREALEADLSMLGWLSSPMGGFQRGFDLSAYRTVIRHSLDVELDYIKEAEQQTRYASLVTDLGIIVPEVIDELSGPRVLVTTWEDGDTIATAAGWSREARFALAKRIMSHFVTMVLEHGEVHADPHSGNYRFRAGTEDPTVVLYDFGCVHQLTRLERLSLLRLIDDTSKNAGGDPYPLFLNLGFDPATLQPVRHKLPALCRVLFEPFRSPMKFDLTQWNRGERIGDILGEDRWNFRISGPAHMVFLMRAFHGLQYYLRELGEPISWSRLLAPILASNDEGLRDVTLPVDPDPKTTFESLARHLCIRVSRENEVRAKVSLPAEAIESLEDVIDPAIRGKIKDRDIDLPAIISRVRRTQFVPQEIFRLEDGAKLFEVWME